MGVGVEGRGGGAHAAASSGERQEASDSNYSTSNSEASGGECPEHIPKLSLSCLPLGLLGRPASYIKSLRYISPREEGVLGPARSWINCVERAN